ncbi:PKD domain-containing protein [Natrinema sp. 1APR25-10V2]|uniref:PKD domain-containing protein n=1 Tax=Natrinema sp. 1APR25-10V2 TaxID=2951081 RepID=UPI002876C98A|nr:PKD domain-containing protein [Natrinema sp. 1APR25-10V2]MDS0473434.1 PKD domain-containing protein [Natrinema sp. 1APR25-10V2]
MRERDPSDSISRRNVLKTVGGSFAGASLLAGRSAAQEAAEVEPVTFDVECERDGGQGNRAGRVHLANEPGFTDVRPWIEARVEAVNGSYRRSIVLGPGASTSAVSGLENGTYTVGTYFDPDSEGHFDPDSADPVLAAEETFQVDCPGPYEFDLAFESRPAVVGETVRIDAVPSRPPERGFNYYWDFEAGESDGISGDPTTREATDEPQVEYVYDEPGEYEVELTVEFLDESELTVSEVLTVVDPDLLTPPRRQPDPTRAVLSGE